MPVSAWQAKSCALGLVCAGQAAHTRRSEIAARGASLHVSAFVHDSCCWSTKKVRYANFGVLGAKDGLEHAIELPALAVAQGASDASNHLFAQVDEEIEALARGTHRKDSHDVEQDVVSFRAAPLLRRRISSTVDGGAACGRRGELTCRFDCLQCVCVCVWSHACDACDNRTLLRNRVVTTALHTAPALQRCSWARGCAVPDMDRG